MRQRLANTHFVERAGTGFAVDDDRASATTMARCESMAGDACDVVDLKALRYRLATAKGSAIVGRTYGICHEYKWLLRPGETLLIREVVH